MPIDRPNIPNCVELNCYDSTITSGYCDNVNLAFDDDPTTAAVFVTPQITYNPSQYQLIESSNAETVLTGVNCSAGDILFLSVIVGGAEGYTSPGTISGVSGTNGLNNWQQLASFLDVIHDQADDVWSCLVTEDIVDGSITITDLDVTPLVRGALFGFSNVSLIDGFAVTNINAYAATTIPANYLNELFISFMFTGGSFTDPPWTQVAGNFSSLEYYETQTNAAGTDFTLPAATSGEAITTLVLLGLVPNFTTNTRFLKVDFGKNFWLGALRYLADGPGAINAGVDYLGPYGTPEPDIPMVMPPLPVGGNISEYIYNPPVLAKGIIIYPDAFTPSSQQGQFPTMNLYQIQLYESITEAIAMSGPATGLPLELGISQAVIFPWNAASSYAQLQAITATRDYLSRPQTLDAPYDWKSAEEYGGESPHQRGLYSYESKLGWKLTFQRSDLYALNLAFGGTYVYAPGTGSNPLANNQQQLWTNNLTDILPYFSAIFLSTYGDPTMIYICPKCKVNSGLARSLDRTKITDLVLSFDLVFDDTWIRQDGTVGQGATFEQLYNAGPNQSQFS